MLTGSVARGDAYPGSDLDFYILLENGHIRKFHSEVKKNIIMEYKHVNFETALFNLENNPMEIYSFLDGRILFDKKDLLLELKTIALQNYEDYSISEKEAEEITHWLRSSVNKIEASIERKDEFKASYVASTSTWVMLEGVWAVNNKPTPPSGAVWAHLKDLPIRMNNMDELLNNVFMGRTSIRITSFISIAEWIISRLENV